MAKKNVRELKVCAQSGYQYKDVPSIRLMGQWLEAAGFHIGDPMLVKCENGQLIITPDSDILAYITPEKLHGSGKLLPPVNFAEASAWRYLIVLNSLPFIGNLLFVVNGQLSH